MPVGVGAVQSTDGKLGTTAEALRLRQRWDAIDSGRRPGVTSEERERVRERETRK